MSANKFKEALNVLNSMSLTVKEYKCIKILQELVDKEIKMSKFHEEIYNAYHYGTKEELDKQVSELIYQIEYDWSDQE